MTETYPDLVFRLTYRSKLCAALERAWLANYHYERSPEYAAEQRALRRQKRAAAADERARQERMHDAEMQRRDEFRAREDAAICAVSCGDDNAAHVLAWARWSGELERERRGAAADRTWQEVRYLCLSPRAEWSPLGSSERQAFERDVDEILFGGNLT